MEIEVYETEKGKSVRTNKHFFAKDIIVEFAGTIKETPDKHSLQIAVDKHLSGVDWPEFINHSCSPNCYISVDSAGVWLVAIKDINRGEEITFDYNTTEYDMANPFKCLCCGREIKGYKHLTVEEKDKINSWILPYLKEAYGNSTET